MFCEKCGSQVNENEAVCSNCGAPVGKAPEKKGFSVEMFKFDMKKSNLVALISSALMIIMTFLPYATVEVFGMSESATLIDGDGIFFIIIALCGIAAGLAGEKKWILGVGIAGCALALFEVIDFADASSQLGAASDMLSRGIGFYLMIVSAAGLVAAPFVEKYIPKDKFSK